MLTSSQIRAARGLLSISQLELSCKSGISIKTIQKMETEGTENSNFSTIRKIKNYFENKNIKFISARQKDGLGEGVRFIYESVLSD